MSMSVEHAEALKNEVAVVCCRTEEGTILAASNLEDPDIFPDMVDSGLLTIPEDCLKVGQVIGAKLIKTIDSLTPLTPDILEGIKVAASEEKTEDSINEKEAVCCEENDNCINNAETSEEIKNIVTTTTGGVLKIRIEEGKGIDIELPF
jgi:hypothetical protein